MFAMNRISTTQRWSSGNRRRASASRIADSPRITEGLGPGPEAGSRFQMIELPDIESGAMPTQQLLERIRIARKSPLQLLGLLAHREIR